MIGQDFIFLTTGLLGGWVLHQKLQPSPSSKTIDNAPPSALPSETPISETLPTATAKIEPDIPETPASISEAYQRLTIIERFKSSFLARTAHELRSPINSLIGLHQLILEDLCETPQEEREFVGQAKESALKILRLLDTLIAASKLDSGREPVQLQRTGVADLFQNVQNITQLQAANHNLRYEVVIPDEEMAILSDGQWLQSLLTGLIEDAISNTQLGTIRLWAAPNPDNQTVDLCLQTDRPIAELQTSLDQLPYDTAIDITDLEEIRLSTSLILAVARTMLASLQGGLTIEPGPNPDEQSLIRCHLPCI